MIERGPVTHSMRKQPDFQLIDGRTWKDGQWTYNRSYWYDQSKRSYKIWLRYDPSYPHQSEAEVSVWLPTAGWTKVAMMPFAFLEYLSARKNEVVAAIDDDIQRLLQLAKQIVGG